MQTDMEKAELEHIRAQIAKLMAETAKLNRETLLYPVIVTTGAVIAVASFTKLFL